MSNGRYIASKNYNLSVLQYIRSHAEIDPVKKNIHLLEKTGCEVILCIDDSLDTDELLKFIHYRFEVNCKLILASAVDMQSAHFFFDLVENVCSREYFLFLPSFRYIRHTTIDELRKSYYLLRPKVINLTGTDIFFTERKNIPATRKNYVFQKLIVRQLLYYISLLPDPTTGETRARKPVAKQFDHQLLYSYEHINIQGLQEYVKRFESSSITSEDLGQKKFRIIALVPVKNEAFYIKGLLNNLQGKCDGVIILDDSSDDDTYEIADDPLILVKVKKHRSKLFLDRDNRNILLDLLSFFNADWAFFIDADELFDDRFCDLYSLTDVKNVDTIGFSLVNLWDEKGQFRTDLPDTQTHRDGIIFRWRMFKIYGRMQIIENNHLHFMTVPWMDPERIFRAPVLLQHYGMFDRQVRLRKYQLYTNEDRLMLYNKRKYEYYLDDKVRLANTDTIELKDIV
jgi:hypothetical protein